MANVVRSFFADHPWPDGEGVDHLYKFTCLSEQHPERLEQLLVRGELFHSLPADLNDPWECNPTVSIPSTEEGLNAATVHLVQSLVDQGLSTEDADRSAKRALRDPGSMEAELLAATQNTYQQIRICSLTANRSNLLLWAHYAGSHGGICIEFDATIWPFPLAYKVKYQTDYPEIVYPIPRDRNALRPLLTKSSDWSYEREYRSLINPEHPPPFPNNGTSALLENRAITAIYFGARVRKDHRDRIVALVQNGPFQPNLLQANIVRTSFTLDFTPI